jgi:hypothetical protein
MPKDSLGTIRNLGEGQVSDRSIELRLLVVAWLLMACGGEEANSLCAEVTCSANGTCIESEAGVTCECDNGYIEAGPNCVEPTVEPAIISFTLKSDVVTEGETARFLLVVSGPAGIDDPVDAFLETPEGKEIAQFKPGNSPRTYEAALSWAQMNALQPITFLESIPRTFFVRVWDDEGFEASASVIVSLECPGDSGSCMGKCDSRMVQDPSLSQSSADCDNLECDGSYPLACFSLPPAYLWMDSGEWGKLMDDVKADVEVDGIFYFMGRCGEVGVEIHGGLARKFDKKSFKVKFNRGSWFPYDPFVPAPEPKPSGKGFKQFIFKAHWVDPSLMRDHLTHDVTTALGGLAPRVTHTNFILNGKYHGIYGLTESVLKDYFIRMGLEGDGNLYKAVNHNANFKDKADAMGGYEKKMNVDGNSDDLALLLENIADAPLDFQSFEETVGQAIDLDLYLAYSVANSYSNNRDAFTKNYYLYRSLEDDGPFLTVNWDADATFGISWDGTEEEAKTGGLWGKFNSLSTKLSKIPEFAAANSQIYHDALAGPLAPTTLHATVDAIASTIQPDIQFEECRWAKENSFADHLEVIHQFVDKRTEFVEEWLE